MKFSEKIKNYVIKHFFELAQISVDEIDDGLTSSDETIALCRQLAAEGCVLVENNGVLPISVEENIAVFGRCQKDYFYVGYGSGGDVKPPYKVSPITAMQEAGLNIDEEVLEEYVTWCAKNVPDDGAWGNWPMNYPEMPVSLSVIRKSAKKCKKAIVIIGRSAGEDRETKKQPGSWYLTSVEEDLLKKVSSEFDKVCVVLNCGSIFDTSWIRKYNIDAVLYAWQGGQESGRALVDVLTGKVNPCGKLTDTVAPIEKYPSTENFGNKKLSIYTEDIFVGYRYFETFAKDSVIYPFGYGLSYSDFRIKDIKLNNSGTNFDITLKVQNFGPYAGKEVVQVYVKKPVGKLGAASRELVAFEKTQLIEVGSSELVEFSVDLQEFASYDDTGVTGNKNSYILEAGEYEFFVGTDIRNALSVGKYEFLETVVKTTLEVCPPDRSFERIVNDGGVLSHQLVEKGTRNLKARIEKQIPLPLPYIKDKKYSFSEVVDGKISTEDFVRTLSFDELETLSRGSLDGMNSGYGPTGNAAVFVATCKSLLEKGVPAICTNDGPSGCRLQAHSTLFPIGAVLASSFNRKLIEETMLKLGEETRARRSHVLLAPGMNIHRNPLCGRNFEYFSEDPYVTSEIASAYVKGVQKADCSAVLKHFCCNNQETGRDINNSVVSQRALREIYLRPFEKSIKDSNPDCVMTSYNKINGLYSYYSFDLCTVFLRDEFNFKGVIMTDWWMKDGKSKEFPNLTNQALRIRAGNNVYMPGALMTGRMKNQSDGSIKAAIDSGALSLGELQRNAITVLDYCKKYRV